ncbi:sugar ABC transporter ATP-binding protein [Flexivirga endophytica]|uniref:Sugar ABC transporter ATP-binding protein n=1 Tax=Flexivirga endophytica TaxID=1849103 RepID=A0A916T0N5_9MICO|nr:sugar ABC transporter ATP-binding protein [Flexivirga endophytica]GGB26898.1 sugar ABC transporter ATP-binding protein [Flexivirga endophytica]
MTDVVKRFPGVVALGGVDLTVEQGEVHCLLGQNGAGKSTLIKVLAGVHRADEGTVEWRGEAVGLPDPQAAMDLGIATMYQELDLVDGLTVAENIFLGHEPSRAGFSQRATARRAAAGLLAELGHPEITPTTEVGALSAAAQQIVSMARALSRDARLIIMDEPSAVLDAGEVEQFFAVIREITARDVAVIYISHRLEEIREIGDRVTVLKDGKTVSTAMDAKTTSTQDLIRLMTGRSIEYVFPRRSPVAGAEPMLRIENLSQKGEFADISFQVRPGEVVGLAGLVGSGRTEIVEAIFGATRATSGTVTVDGRTVRPGSVPAAVAAGIGLCPEERKSQALVLQASLAANISLASLAKFSRAGLLDRHGETRAAEALLDSLDVRPRGAHRESRTLSGGNQQKVVLARWLLRGCKVLLLDEPTRGVDVGARSEIYGLIRELTDQGVAVVVVSSEIPEVLGLSDRVLVIADRTIRHEGPADELDEHAVLDIILKGDAA